MLKMSSIDCEISHAGLQTDVEEQMRTKTEEAASFYDLLSTGLNKSSAGEDGAKMVLFPQNTVAFRRFSDIIFDKTVGWS